ncbi:HNH nuclease [Yersinia pseudotuberculosis]|uniref:HNH endonuclease n=1 Tax=Yersinia pseudotuberculosis TaxID=633 RepID=A0ABM7AEQ6_YERPU|nr:HNH nuclease [Yersinia pseudotuberculosis]AYW91079.1 HNH endonuclease [Yersinia pseudotuberculosis]AYW95741.1 HNH endonuclease [Yersinia pseudotuberculosis]AYX16172.1 HNH endonuclease [Yersinia pseudotuberculosis]MBO1608407.1 HNH endonuclease [Yersinia pseudotuberculosis]MBO1612621.1 HNH endonuclease [Yersinia pseudotuberculosis]
MATFWREVANDPELVGQFLPLNQNIMKRGYAPYPIPTQQVGRKVKFELHHVKFIRDDGAVYYIENIRVMTPKRHIDINSKN